MLGQRRQRRTIIVPSQVPCRNLIVKRHYIPELERIEICREKHVLKICNMLLFHTTNVLLFL